MTGLKNKGRTPKAKREGRKSIPYSSRKAYTDNATDEMDSTRLEATNTMVKSNEVGDYTIPRETLLLLSPYV